MDCAFKAVCTGVCKSAYVAPVPVCWKAHSDQELCGFAINPTGSLSRDKGLVEKQAGEVLCNICGPIGQLDNRFALSSCHQKREHHKKPASSASFDTVQSICPSILLVFDPEDGLPKGPKKASLPTWVCYKAFKQNHLPGVFPFWECLYFSQPFVPSNMLLWCFRHIFLMFYTPYNLLCEAKPILLADIIDGARDLAKVNPAERP